ncbi:hypothetical protein ACWAT4_08675 [Bradyrhizobium manausense]
MIDADFRWHREQELVNLFEQFRALADSVVRLPPGSERRIAFRELRYYGTRIEMIAAKWMWLSHS